jgi:hypothetical protein
MATAGACDPFRCAAESIAASTLLTKSWSSMTPTVVLGISAPFPTACPIHNLGPTSHDSKLFQSIVHPVGRYGKIITRAKSRRLGLLIENTGTSPCAFKYGSAPASATDGFCLDPASAPADRVEACFLLTVRLRSIRSGHYRLLEQP